MAKQKIAGWLAAALTTCSIVLTASTSAVPSASRDLPSAAFSPSSMSSSRRRLDGSPPPYSRPAPPGLRGFYVREHFPEVQCDAWRDLNRTIEFPAEFGMELIVAAPYVYSLHKQCIRAPVVSTNDSKPLYFFSQSHREDRRVRRRFVPYFNCCSVHNVHDALLPTVDYEPPPYKEFYKNTLFTFAKPLLIITNKYQREWSLRPINYIPIRHLKVLVRLLSPYYTVVYSRPTGEIPGDNSELLGYADKQALAGQVRMVEDLWRETVARWGAAMGGALTFNIFQMWLYANSDRFVAVQGGNSVLAAYMAGRGGTVVVLAVAGMELLNNTISTWYGRFSGASVHEVHDGDSLVREAVERFLPADVAGSVLKRLPARPATKVGLVPRRGRPLPIYKTVDPATT
eukprot:gene20671-31852_t